MTGLQIVQDSARKVFKEYLGSVEMNGPSADDGYVIRFTKNFQVTNMLDMKSMKGLESSLNDSKFKVDNWFIHTSPSNKMSILLLGHLA
jgi:hypothetical protein